MAIKGAEGKKGVVYLSVDSSMKENNGQQLKVSGFESSWIYQRTFAESDAEGHHSWVSRLEQQCTHLSFHWCENITHVALFCICTRGLKVIQFQILFNLLLRKEKTRFTKRFELKPSRLLICSRYFFLSSRWLKTIKDYAKGAILTPKKLDFVYTRVTALYTWLIIGCPFFVTSKYALNDAFQSLINAILLEGKPSHPWSVFTHFLEYLPMWKMMTQKLT